eukprot:15351088-Ditylum_brightwellii.AAC.1
MQKESQLWACLLWLTGGLLKLLKCSYYVMHFKFRQDMTSQMQINHKSIYNPHKTLGHFKALVGTSATQINTLKENAESKPTTVMKSALLPTESWLNQNKILEITAGKNELTAQQHQTEIGWQQFFNGHIAKL